MPADRPRSDPGNGPMALIGALLVGLAAGAIWAVVTLYAGREMAWTAPVFGWAVGAVMRRWIAGAAGAAPLLAALAMGLATVYMKCLLAAMQLSALMEFGFVETLRRAGIGMLADLARMSLTPLAIVLYLAGMAVAAWFARRPRERKQHA